MKLIVGLGNPGIRYARTRHNVGFMVVDEVARALDAPDWRRKKNARITEVQGIILLKPQTYMNLSGDSVYEVSRYAAIPASDILIVLDDLDIAPGRLRIRAGGSSAGHKGMQSIIGRLNTSEIARIKVGIGRPDEGVDPADYVLMRPSGPDHEILHKAIKIAADACLMLIDHGLEAAMNKYNGPEPVEI